MSVSFSHPADMPTPKGGWPEVIQGWQCIGCGRIEAQRPCVGICQDRAAHFVDAEDYWRLAEQSLGDANSLRQLQEFLRRLAHTMPRDGAWEHSYLAFQSEAARLLAGPQNPDKNMKDHA